MPSPPPVSARGSARDRGNTRAVTSSLITLPVRLGLRGAQLGLQLTAAATDRALGVVGAATGARCALLPVNSRRRGVPGGASPACGPSGRVGRAGGWAGHEVSTDRAPASLTARDSDATS